MFVLDSLHPLFQHNFDDICQIIAKLSFRYFVEIHEQRDEWRLTVGCLQCDKLILDGLASGFDFFLEFFRNQAVQLFFCILDSGFLKFFAESVIIFLSRDIDKRCDM